MAIGEPGLGNPKYRLVFDEVVKRYYIQQRVLYFFYKTLSPSYAEHELYGARHALNWYRKAETIRKTRKKFIILDD